MATCLPRILLPAVTKIQFNRYAFSNLGKQTCICTGKIQPKTCAYVLETRRHLACKKGPVTYAEIMKLQTECKVILIDVRDRYEIQQTASIPGSVNIPRNLLLTTTRTMAAASGPVPATKDLCYEDVIELKSKNEIILIDVREPSEIKETGKLPGSIHIPLGEVKTVLETLSPAQFEKKYGIVKPTLDANLVFSCRSGKRSRAAMETALSIGFLNSRHYMGGFLDWEKNTNKKAQQA